MLTPPMGQRIVCHGNKKPPEKLTTREEDRHDGKPVRDPSTARFRRYALGNVFVEKLHTGMRWAEGPVWFGDGGHLIWSDIPNNRMMRWVEGGPGGGGVPSGGVPSGGVPSGGVSVFRSPSNFSNGNTRDRQGRLVTCEHGARRVTRTEYDGSITALADSYRGRRLNSPNDVVVKSHGSVWFTDPPYGILTDYEGHRAEIEQDGCHVYRIDPETGQVGGRCRRLRQAERHRLLTG